MKLFGQTNPRSEEIRRRRLNQSHSIQQGAKPRKKRVVAPAPPPVMARTPIAGVSRPVSESGKKSRRLYNVSLDAAHGAEMSLPSLPRLILSWRLVSILLLGGLGFALYHFWESPAYRVGVPEINGLKRIDINQVNAELGLIGEPVFMLDAQTIHAELMTAFPEFSAAEVEIEFPNTVWITVTERVPVLTWVRGGDRYLVDAQGITFPARGAGLSGSYPSVEAAGDPPVILLPEEEDPTLRDATISKITGVLLPQLSPQDQVKPLLTPEMVQAILLVHEQAPAGAKIIYDPVHGLGWIDRRGWTVYMGGDQDTAMKIQVYRAIFEQLKSEDVRPTMISVEYVHAPYYRLEQ